MEVRVQGAVEVVQERMKQLEKTTRDRSATTPGEGPAGTTRTLGLPIGMTRQVSCTAHYE